ncbi:transcriptional regulator, IclR family [Tistlia consotensis]|uniref:Transcriptional regulator, IclR family n=1 Tax=Tistlia consotensis USBA 355 TaxID=560819 RepID=A0A1Y6CBT6_9PROT|nr:IclR family transcriptional regulator [Tistlia consotensis]SMF47446.1 transcriptional regulator, IclR family [Tistlia consotensis USBA 355]SNR82490.1 transcriptional regulator, IclR family [Tistlia consotensis]
MTDVSQTFDRGLSVLEFIDAAPAPIGVREIARRLNLGTSIVQRLVNTLEQRGFVEQVSDTRRYRIGHRAVVLGKNSRHDDTLITAAHVQLVRLAEKFGLNGFLGILKENRAVYVLCVPSRQRVVLRVDAGETMPLHTTALGRVLLAALGDEQAGAILGSGPLERIMPNSITDPAAIVARLPDVRRLGYASVDEENLPAVVSVGAPVRNAAGAVVAGLSVAYTKNTVTVGFDEVVEVVVAASLEVSRELGCPDALGDSWVIAR